MSINHVYRFLLIAVGLAAVSLAGCGDAAPRPAASSSAANTGAPASSNDKLDTIAAKPKPVDPNAPDFRALPPIENAKYTILTANRLEGTTGDKAAAIYEHYRTELEKLGWKLSAPPSKDQVTDESASGLLNKSDVSIFLSIVPYGDPHDKSKPMQRQFTVDYLGACNSGKLPRLPGAEPGYASKNSSVYFTDMKVPATAASVKNLLMAAGWQPYTKSYSAMMVLPNRIRDHYRKDGNSLRVLIGPVPGKAGKSSVEYVIGAIGHQLPALADATEVEFDDATCRMRCNVPRDIALVTKYYQSEMSSLGFEVQKVLSDENKSVMVCKSNDLDIGIDLIYIGVNTRVEISKLAPKENKPDGGAKMPDGSAARPDDSAKKP